MDAPAEAEFLKLLAVGVGLLLLLGSLLVLFVVTYQKRLLQQQLRLRAAEAEYQQQLLAAVVDAQELERERIGRDLHDGVGATLATSKLLLSRLPTLPLGPETGALHAMLTEALDTAMHETRGIAHSLFPAVLTRYGLAEALHHLIEVSGEASALAFDLDINYAQPLALAQELALYRICQELIHNALKHARGATHLAVRLQQQGPRLELTVTDDGCGFQPAAALLGTGAGLRSIEVRVQLLQASLRRHSEPGRGTRTTVELPGLAAATS